MEDLKSGVYKLCLTFIERRIDTAETALAQAQEASNDDTKSSAGDKFETTREMMQQDITRNKGLLADAKQNLQLLNSLEDVPFSESARNGSLVYTSRGLFYISIPAGQLSYKGQQIFAISASSPIGHLLLGKKAGDSISFNKNDYQIEAVV